MSDLLSRVEQMEQRITDDIAGLIRGSRILRVPTLESRSPFHPIEVRELMELLSPRLQQAESQLAEAVQALATERENVRLNLSACQEKVDARDTQLAEAVQAREALAEAMDAASNGGELLPSLVVAIAARKTAEAAREADRRKLEAIDKIMLDRTNGPMVRDERAGQWVMPGEPSISLMQDIRKALAGEPS